MYIKYLITGSGMDSDIADDSVPERSDWADEMSEEESPRKKIDTGYYRIPRLSAEEMQARKKAEEDAIQLQRMKSAKKTADEKWRK
jgi:hypothetical protein